MSAQAKKDILFLTSKGPWSSAAPAACADFLMTAAIFDQNVSLVFCGDGVFQLLQGQDGSSQNQKTLANLFPALELYDVRHIYATASALKARGLSQQDLVIDTTLATDEKVRSLIADSDAVFVF